MPCAAVLDVRVRAKKQATRFGIDLPSGGTGLGRQRCGTEVRAIRRCCRNSAAYGPFKRGNKSVHLLQSVVVDQGDPHDTTVIGEVERFDEPARMEISMPDADLLAIDA